jgi:hypothetical protein
MRSPPQQPTGLLGGLKGGGPVVAGRSQITTDQPVARPLTLGSTGRRREAAKMDRAHLHAHALGVAVEPSLQLADRDQLAAPKAHEPHVRLDMRAPGIPGHAQRFARLLDAERKGGRTPVPGGKGRCRTWRYWSHHGYRPRPAWTGHRIAPSADTFVRRASRPVASGLRLSDIANTPASPAVTEPPTSALPPSPVPRASTACGLLAGLPAYARSQRGSPLRGGRRSPPAYAQSRRLACRLRPRLARPAHSTKARTD